MVEGTDTRGQHPKKLLRLITRSVYTERPVSEMARRFPSLEMLDQEPIQKITFDVPPAESSSKSIPQSAAPTTFPNEMGSSFVTGVPGNIVSDFLMR